MIALMPIAEIIVLEASAKEYEELARHQAAGSRTYAYPVVSGTRLFLKDQEFVSLWTVE